MSETAYIETSILGYLTARSTKDLILAANIEITKDWWELRRNTFILYTSEAVLDEVAQGDAEIAAQRLEILRDFSLLALNQAVQDLAAQFLARSAFLQRQRWTRFTLLPLPYTAWITCLTWNCKHIANAQIQGKLAEISLDFGYVLPILCTPNELMGD